MSFVGYIKITEVNGKRRIIKLLKIPCIVGRYISTRVDNGKKIMNCSRDKNYGRCRSEVGEGELAI